MRRACSRACRLWNPWFASVRFLKRRATGRWAPRRVKFGARLRLCCKPLRIRAVRD